MKMKYALNRKQIMSSIPDGSLIVIVRCGLGSKKTSSYRAAPHLAHLWCQAKDNMATGKDRKWPRRRAENGDRFNTQRA